MDNFYIFCAKYLIFLIAFVVFGYWLMQLRPKKLRLGLTLILGAIFALVIAKVSGKFYYHPRPFVAENIRPLIKHVADNSFPSEHATFSAVLAAGTYFFNKRLGLGLFVAAIFVGIGRIGAHVHYPIDVIAGLMLGAFASWLGFKLAGKILEKKQPAVKPAVHED
jgi:undecaprenyl-diphosphatase